MERVYVAGHRGLIGSALVRRLRASGYRVLTQRGTDLREPVATLALVRKLKPDVVILAAGRCGGIQYNLANPVGLMQDNLAIQASVMAAAHGAGIPRLLWFACACVYPREAPQPMRPSSLLTGVPEPTSQPFALAKLAGIALCEAYRLEYPGRVYQTIIPATVYGPGDSFDPNRAHVLSSLIWKAHRVAMSGEPLTILGTGTPKREFIYVDDLADACGEIILNGLRDGVINIGTGISTSIRYLAEMVLAATGLNRVDIVFDTTKPDGAPLKLLDSSVINALGWRAKTTLREGIERTFVWFREHLTSSTASPTQRSTGKTFRT